MIAYTQRDTLGRETAVTSIRLDLKGAAHFPDWLFSLSNLAELHLFNARFGSVHFADWPWPKLEKLKLLNCGLEKISISDPEPIGILLLDLSQNKNLIWPADFLKKARNLQSLWFSGNKLSTTEPGGLGNLTHLRILHLDGNDLSGIPSAIFRLEQLRILNISHNRIGKLPKAISRLKHLDQFFAGNNHIRRLPDTFGALHTLSQLYLESNRLAELPDSLERCLVLRKLDLSNNNFKIFPAFLHKLFWLGELDLSKNKISTLPARMDSFRQLTKLDLGNNTLTKFAFEPHQLPKLRELKLYRNKLSGLPVLPPTLFSLDISSNQLTSIPSTLLDLPDLKELFLEKNRIAFLPKDFGNLQHSLIRLAMAGNPVKTNPEALLALRQLKEVTGLMGAARRRDLMLAQQSARNLDLPFDLAEPFYRLIRSDRSVLPDLSPEAVLLALNHPEDHIANHVRRYVQRSYGLPRKGRRLGKGSVLGITGRTFFKRIELEKRLTNLGIELLPDYHPEQCTHLLLGFPPLSQKILPARQVIFNEKQLVLRLDQMDKKPLLKESSETRLSRLRQLLTSPDTTNIRLGFRMIAGNGLPKDLWNELLAAYYLSERDPALQLQIKSYIRLRLEDQGKNKFFAALTPQLVKWGKIKPEKEELLRRNRFDLERILDYLK